jgi:hypothetical protein
MRSVIANTGFLNFEQQQISPHARTYIVALEKLGVSKIAVSEWRISWDIEHAILPIATSSLPLSVGLVHAAAVRFADPDQRSYQT